MEIRRLQPDDISLIGEIDRSEHIRVAYEIDKGHLVSRSVDWDVPTWHPEGTGNHTVAGMIDHWRPIVEGGAVLLGAYDQHELLGLAIVDGVFEPKMAWLALLHVNRRHRRCGVASALWSAAAEIAGEAGADSIYVSATPSGSAVGFYLDQGGVPADPPHPDLYAREPEDIHFVCPVG